MAFKVTKKEVMKMSNVELLKNFEQCIVEIVKEDNFNGGASKQTESSYFLLKNKLLDVLGSEETYDDSFNIVKRK